MNVINMPARAAAEIEIITLSAELHDRALIGATGNNAAVVAQLARRIADTADALART